MDQLVTLVTRTLLLAFLFLSSVKEEQKQQLSFAVMNVDTFKCPQTINVSCRNEEPPIFKSLREFLSGGGRVVATCGIDSSSFTFAPVVSDQKCNKTTSTIYTIHDSCGGIASCNHVIQVRDQTPPEGFCPGITLNCDDPEPVILRSYYQFITALHNVTPEPGHVTDNCSLDTSSFIFIKATKEFSGKCLTAIVHQYAIFDSCQNGLICNQRFTIIDNVNPQFVPARDTILYLSSACFVDTTIATLGNIQSIKDNCGVDSVSYHDVSQQGCVNSFASILRIWRVVDNCKNATVDTQFITVLDTIKPTISGPPGLIVQCASEVPPADTNLIFAMDNCAQLVIRFFVKDSVSDSTCTNNKIINRIYSASDPCNNTSVFKQVIVLKDTVPPVLSCPDSQTVSCVSLLPLKNPNLASAMDFCDGIINTIVKDSVINLGCVNQETVYRIFSATDHCNNTARCIQVITVKDQTPPLITSFPKDTTVDCMNHVPVPNPSSILTSDNCGGSTTVSHLKDSTTNQICPINKKIHRIYQAKDQCGNSISRIQLITVLDTIAPVLMGPSNTKLLNCGSSFSIVVPTATDNCPGSFTVTTSSRIVDGICPGNYQLIYTFSAKDSCNNIGYRYDTITYQDITPPIITCPPSQEIDCLSPPITDLDSFLVDGKTFSDLCGLDSNSFKLSKETSKLNKSKVVTTRTYSIEDLCGNADTCTQIITTSACFTDLALKKTLNSKLNPYLAKPGSAVPFCITVYNQGFVITDSIKLIEYFPVAGAKIFSPGWINNPDGTACIYLSRANGRLPSKGLLPGDQVQICYDVKLSDTTRGGITINRAEINEVRDTFGNLLSDIDSKADNDPDNDSGGVPLSPDDDNINGDSYLGEDEDDADPALFFVIPDLTCINNVNASVRVDATCGRCFTASDVLKGIVLPDSLYTITLFDSYGNKLPSNCVGIEQLGYTITFSVSLKVIPTNSCWGTVKIEDKAPPLLDCTADTLDCIAYVQAIPLPIVYDNCSGRAEVTVVREKWTDFGCSDSRYAGVLTRSLSAKDKWNNTISCDKQYYIRKIDITKVTCPADTIFECPDTLHINNPVYTGAPGYQNTRLWPLNVTCNLFMAFSDQRTELCGAGFKIFRTWIIGDACSGQELKCIQVIKVEDHTPPVIDSFNHTILLNADPHECVAILDLQKVPVTDCSGIEQAYTFLYQDLQQSNKAKVLSGSIPAQIKLPSGVNKIFIDIHDVCNNYTRDSIIVIVSDVTPPTPVCHAETQLTLDPDDCSSWIAAKDLDNGSHDNCCSELHFAAAYLSDIQAARSAFIAKITSECGNKEYWDHKAWYDEYIEDWINYYVFKDTLLGTSCGRYQVVLRVYEACDLPRYDAHVFPCSPHAWYFYNTSWRYRVVFNKEFRAGAKSCDVAAPWDCKSNLTTSFNSLNSFSQSWYQSIPLYKNCDKLFGSDLTQIPCVKKLYNDCMIQVLLDDKQSPRIADIPPVTIYCDGVNITQGGSASASCHQSDYYGASPNAWPGQIKAAGNSVSYGYYGGSFFPSHDDHQTITDICPVQNDGWSPIYCRKWLELDSFDRGQQADPADLFYRPVIVDKNHPAGLLRQNEFRVSDNCIVDSVSYVDSKIINSCHEGWIQRTWTVKDKCGNTETSSQKIIIKHRSDFEVIFPEDKIVDCSDKKLADTGIDHAGIPIISDNDCEQIGIRYEDQLFYTAPDACYKIVRTWTIIDWCIFDPNEQKRKPDIIVNDTLRGNRTDQLCAFRNLKDNNDGYMTYAQIIKIVDHEAPRVLCKDTSICVTDGCALNVNIPLSGADNCADTLFYRVDITYPDGTHDRRANIQSIQGSFSVGVYPVTVIGEDGCLNADTCSFKIYIMDCKKPTPYCLNGLATVIMPASGSLEVWARDLDLNSSDNCTPANQLRYSFSKDTAFRSRILTCNDIKNGIEQAIPVEIWVTDQAGLQDFCTTYLLLQDKSGNVCPDLASSTAIVKGSLNTEQKEPVQFAKLAIKGFGTEGLPAFQTNADGSYYFGSLPIKSDYTISATRDDNPLNGVSTLDLVLIQKHILGFEKLNSPYKMIAADVDGDHGINVIDLLELRKLILGIYDKLPNSTSWKFVPKSYQFPDPANPWGFPMEEQIKEMSGDLVKDFIGVKIGDVNSSVIPHSLLGTEVRTTAHELIFEVDDQWIVSGQTIVIKFKSPNFRGICGFQGTLSTGPLKYLSPVSGTLNGDLHLTRGNIGTRWLDNGRMLTLSWNDIQGTGGFSKDIAEDRTLFELEFKATQSGRLSDMLRFGSQHTLAESYEGKGEVGSVIIQFKDPASNKLTAKSYMDQNYPNPFNHNTMIGINLADKCPGVLGFYDSAGRLIYKIEKDWNKGYNEVQIDRDMLSRQTPVLIYYKFQSNSFNDTKKMLLLE